MKFLVGMENNNEGVRSLAWALEHPGCFAYGENAEKALAALPAAIRAYALWISQHEPAWLQKENIELEVEAVWDNYYVDKNFDRVPAGDGHEMVDSWFQHDWKPLQAQDIERGLKLLAWSRAELLSNIQGLPASKLDQTYPGERWSINGILKHLGGAEWWYLDNIGKAFPKSRVPENPLKRLEKVRQAFIDLLPKLEGVNLVVGSEGEFWSPRKVLRRAVWHERDHTAHIRKLL